MTISKLFAGHYRARRASIALSALTLLVVSSACNPRPPVAAPYSLSTTAVPLTPAPTTSPVITPIDEMRAALTYLSSDELEGRGLQTNGINLAAAYIAGNFHAAGLLPLPGMSDYFQRFDLTTAEGIAPETSFTANGQSLKLNDDYNVLSFSAEKSFDAPAIFVGYGITSPEHKYDDYANVDVKGKVVIAWRFEPADKDGKSRFIKGDWSEAAHLDTKVKNAADHGAIGVILANPPLSKSKDILLPFAHSYQESSAALPVLHVKHKLVDEWLKAATGEEAKTIEEHLDAGPVPQSKLLKDFTLTGKVAIKRSTRPLRNIAGYLPGVGPHADEYIIVGAHYDHLGRGEPGSLAVAIHAANGDKPKSTTTTSTATSPQAIHHGADDNGSGTTTIIELAREFGDAYAHGQRWSRSIVFVTFTAEEAGLIGSSHFVNHPPIPLDKVVAMLNLDMVGRLREEKLFVGGSGTAPSLQALLDEADKGSHLLIKDSGKGGLGPSDHMSFAIKKIPVLFFFTGLHADYHRPTDTVDKINFQGMAEILELSKRLIVEMTEMPKEKYVSSADAHSMTMGLGSGSGTGSERRATLGVIPIYGEDEGIKGVKISGTTEDSPAAKAGLKENDIITSFNKKKLDSLMDLSTALAEAKPGDKVRLKVTRDGKEVELEATLAERK